MIPLNERHLRMMLRPWVTRRSGKSSCSPLTGLRNHRHRLPRVCEIGAKDILGGLHHEYRLERRVA
jgi:hypothetical protein